MAKKTEKHCGTCKHFEPWGFNPERGRCQYPVPWWLMDTVRALSATFDHKLDLGSDVGVEYGWNCPTWSEKKTEAADG